VRDNLKINNEIKIIGLYAIVFVLLIIALNLFFITGLLDSHNFYMGMPDIITGLKTMVITGLELLFSRFSQWYGKDCQLDNRIVFFNSILFLISFYFLIRTLETSTLETILYLSIPSFIFFYLPFTESIFFASSTLLLFGLKNKKIHFVVTGLLLCTLSRPAFIIFIPALIITELLSEKSINNWF